MSMILENAIGLWSLLAIIAVLILHRLRQRPERLQVSSLLIWKRIEPLLTSAPVRRKSRLYLILIIQILAVVFLSLALARPVRITTRPEPLHLVFLIDNSASMGGLSPYLRDNAPKGTRWNYLNWQINDLIAESPPDTSVSFYQPLPLKSFLRLRRDEASNVLAGLKQMNIPSDLESLLSLIQGVNGELYFCSDKLPPEPIINKFPKKPHLILVGDPYPNQAIIGATATPTPGKTGYYDIFNAVKNYSRDQSARVKLELVSLEADNSEVKLGLQEAEIAINQSGDFFFREIRLPPEKAIKLSIMPADPYDLSYDNQVTLFPPRPCKINIAGQDNQALTRALKSIPSIALENKSEVADLTVFNEILPETLPDKSIVINGMPGSKAFWDYQGRIERPEVAGADTSSPILKYCDPAVFNNIPYARKLLPKEKEYIRPIITAHNASGDECVLIGEWRKIDRHLVLLNFPLEWRNQTQTEDWTLTPTFPIFWTNLINYLHLVSRDYTIGEGLCDDEESDNYGVTVFDANIPAPEARPQMEMNRSELWRWFILGAAGLLLLSWILSKR